MPSIYSSARTELAKLLIYGLFRKIRVLAQDGVFLVAELASDSRAAGGAGDRPTGGAHGWLKSAAGRAAGNELRTRKEHVSDRDAGFKQPLERCNLLTHWAFEYFDQTSIERYARRVEIDEIEANDCNLNISRYVSTAEEEVAVDLSVTHKELVEIEKQIQEVNGEAQRVSEGTWTIRIASAQ